MQNDSGASLAETIYRKMSDEELQNTLRCETFSDGALDRKSTRLNSSHKTESRMPSSA